MKKLLLGSVVLVSLSAFADTVQFTSQNSGTGTAEIYTGGAKAALQIDGEAARVLYEALDVVPRSSTGIVQTWTKTVSPTECVQSIMGDIPGKVSAAVYKCVILIDKK